MLGFSPLASAPLAADSDRMRADLEGRLAGAINLSGSADANASVRSEGAAALNFAVSAGGSCANAAVINGASAASGFASAKVKLNSSASATIGITGDSVASVRLKAQSLSFWDVGGLSHAGVATRTVSAAEFLVARAMSADVDAIGGVSISMAFVLNAAAVSGARATAAGSLALAASAASAAVVKPVLVTSVAFDGQSKAGATPAAGLDNQIAILGIAAAYSASSAVFARYVEAAVASSAALFTRANANGSLQIAGPIRTTADVAVRADSQILPGGSSVAGAYCRISASGVMTFGAMSSGGVASTSTAAATFVALTQSEVGVPVDVLSARAIDLTGSVVGRVANAAGIDGSVASGGLAGSVTHTDAEAQSVLGLKGHSRCALASSARTDDILRVVSIIHAEASGAGNAAGEIGTSGSAVTLAAVAMAFDATVTPAGVARSTIAGRAASQSAVTIQHIARADTGAASEAQSDLAIKGGSSGSSQAPLFAQTASGILIGGFAKLEASVSGAAKAGQSLDWVGASDAGCAVSSAGRSTIDVALKCAADAALPAMAASVVSINGGARTKAQPVGRVLSVLSMSGSSTGLLVVSATALRDLPLLGMAAALARITGLARGTFDVTRSLTSDVDILADAARGISLQGQSVAQVSSSGTATSAAAALLGVTTAIGVIASRLHPALDVPGAAEVKTSIICDASIAFEVGLSTSVFALGQAASEGSLAISGAAGSVTGVLSAAISDLASSGNANAAVLLHAKASAALGFTRDVAAEALIDATSARTIAFRLVALAHVDLAASSVGQALYYLAASAALRTHAKTSDVVDLAGVTSAQTGVQASSEREIEVAGTAMSRATASSGSLGVFTMASAGEADAAIIANSAPSLPFIGDTATTAQLTADAVGGTFNVGLIVTAKSDARGLVSRTITLAGCALGKVASHAQADSSFVVTRTGAGDVAVVGRSGRIVTLLGQASVATSTMGAANTSLPVQATASSEVRLLSAVQSTAFGTSEKSAAVINIDGTVQRALWPIAGGSIAFLAPPSQRRGAFVSAQQGGGVLSKPQGGGIIPARITYAA